jgi:nonsense-mediated mRNA decay protein 3
MFAASHAKIPCCLCGTMIFPNDANQCATCLAQQFDLRDILQKNGEPHIVRQCRQCRRFARTDTLYQLCEPESAELLTICLKKIPALITSKGGTSNKLQIVDAIWVWTEPHSMRLKVRLTIRTEMESVQIKQRVLVEYHVHWKMCDDCDREYSNRTWHAVVQLRQKRDLGANRKGLAAMEMALQRNKDIRKKVLKIDACKNGLDFYFLTLQKAQSFAQFLEKLAPMRIKASQKLVSADVKSNTGELFSSCNSGIRSRLKSYGRRLGGVGFLDSQWISDIGYRISYPESNPSVHHSVPYHTIPYHASTATNNLPNLFPRSQHEIHLDL